MVDLTINHSFVSAKLDGSDKSLVKPTDWNAAIPYVGELPTGFGGTGVSTFLVDESDTVLTDEAGVPLDSVNTIDANLLVNNDPNFVEITFADSPFTMTRPDSRRTILDVDCTNGTVIITLYPMVKFDIIDIKKTDSSGNKLTYRGNGFNIDGSTERDISTQYNNDKLVGGTSQWQRR